MCFVVAWAGPCRGWRARGGRRREHPEPMRGERRRRRGRCHNGGLPCGGTGSARDERRRRPLRATNVPTERAFVSPWRGERATGRTRMHIVWGADCLPRHCRSRRPGSNPPPRIGRRKAFGSPSRRGKGSQGPSGDGKGRHKCLKLKSHLLSMLLELTCFQANLKFQTTTTQKCNHTNVIAIF